MSATRLCPRFFTLAGLALLIGVAAILGDPGLASAATHRQTAPSITLSPASALLNQSVAVTGVDFTTGGNETVASISVGGVPVSGDKISFGQTVSISSGGNFVANLIVPVNAATLSFGSVAVTVTDSAGASASASLTLTTPSLSVSPASSRVGSKLAVTGSSFPMASGSVGADGVPAVTLEYETASKGYQRVAKVFPDSAGGFTAAFTVPSDVGIPSEDNGVRATMPNSSAVITAGHSVVAPSITLSPDQGSPGVAVTVEAANFEAFAPVESLSIGNLALELPAGRYTDGNGGLSATFVVPEMDGGVQSLTLTVRGLQYAQTFTVQSGATGPQVVDDYSTPPQRFEVGRALRPLKDNLKRVFSFDNRTKHWSFYDPDPELAYFNTLTELVEGQVYWIAVQGDQSLLTQGRIRSFIAGWNLIVW